MSDSEDPMDEAAAGGKAEFSSKVMSGIASSGKKVASGGESVMSGIKSGTEKVASSGGKAMSGIATSGSKAIKTITSPIGSAVRNTVDKASTSLHGNSSHSTSSAKDDSMKEDSTPAPSALDKIDSAPAPKDETAPEEKQAAKSTTVVASSESAPEKKPATDSAAASGLLGSAENVTNKLLVTPVKGVAELVAEGGNKLLVTPVKSMAHKAAEGGKAITQRSKEALHINSKGASRGLDNKENEADEDLPDVPPDDTLEKMNVIINKRLKDVSITDYYAIGWSEGYRTNKPPLYGPWLKESGKQDINVGEWQFAEEGQEFVGDFDGEKYTQKRIVTFVFNKQIPFQMGPTLAKVKHTQYCRVEGEDKCVLAMTIDMSGVPYSDCFKVEIRWVATRSGKNDIAIQVGLFVNFVKSTIMASKIRSGTTDQTTQQQVQLFVTIKKACGAVTEEVVEEPKETEDNGGQFSCGGWFSNVFPFGHKDALANRNDEIAMSAKSANKKMQEVMTVLSDTDPSDTDPVVLDQLVVVNGALDKILST